MSEVKGALPACPICGEKAWKESTGLVVHLVRSTWCPLSVLAFDEKHWRIRSAPVVVPAVSRSADQDKASDRRGDSEWKWLPWKQVMDAIRNMTPHTWTKDFGLKYIDLRIDTRDMHILVKDRDGKQIELDRIERAVLK